MRSCERVAYEVDPHNRLISSASGQTSKVPRFRHIVDGEFKIDSKNELVYHVKRSPGFTSPQQIRFCGSWSLNEEHNLVFTLNKWSNQCEGNSLVIKGGIIDVRSNELIVSIQTKDDTGCSRFSLLRLSGSWQADACNRLCFDVEKENGPTDRLIFTGAWVVDRQHQIVYTYTNATLRKKENQEQALTFKGYWEVAAKHRITYVLHKASGSRFDFTAGFGKAEKNILVYEVEVGVIPQKRLIRLHGEWKLDSKLGVLFEVECADTRVHAFIFGASCKLREDRTIEAKLKDRSNKDLGIEARFSKRWWDSQGEAFIQAFVSKREVGIYAGAGLRW